MSNVLWIKTDDNGERPSLAERVRVSVRKETRRMVLVGTGAMLVQGMFNLAIVFAG